MTMLGEGATKHSAATAVGNGAPAAGLIKVMIVDDSAVVRGQVGSGWEITPDIRAVVRFRADNLVLDSQETGGFDVIFCRNVLIYFDEDTKRRVLAKLASKLAGDGYLVLGAAETTTGLSQDFVAVPEARHGVFVMTREAPEAKAARKGQAAEAGSSSRVPCRMPRALTGHSNRICRTSPKTSMAGQARP